MLPCEGLTQAYGLMEHMTSIKFIMSEQLLQTMILYDTICSAPPHLLTHADKQQENNKQACAYLNKPTLNVDMHQMANTQNNAPLISQLFRGMMKEMV